MKTNHLLRTKADNNRTDHIGEEANVDGLTPVVLKAHYEKDTVVNSCLVLESQYLCVFQLSISNWLSLYQKAMPS